MIPTLKPSFTKGKIYIYVDDGNFTYVPAHYRAYGGEEITFVCSSPFEVVFKDGTPGDKLYLSDQDPTLTISDTAAYSSYRIYHYGTAVAVAQGGGKTRVFLDAACGDIGVGQ